MSRGGRWTGKQAADHGQKKKNRKSSVSPFIQQSFLNSCCDTLCSARTTGGNTNNSDCVFVPLKIRRMLLSFLSWGVFNSFSPVQPKMVQMSCFPLATYMQIWFFTSLFWLLFWRPLVKNCKAASLACHSSPVDVGQIPTPCIKLLLFTVSFAEQSSWLFRLFLLPLCSVDKYSRIPKIAWNDTIDIST